MITNRLKVLLAVLALTIGVAVLTRPSEDTSTADDASYERQLEAMRQKRKTAAKPDLQVSTNSTGSVNDSASGYANLEQTKGNLPLSDHVTQNFQSTLQNLQNMMPLANRAKLPVANYDSNAQRLQYLQTMPITVIEATSKPDALAMARQDAGRADPFSPLAETQQFPKQKSNQSSQGSTGKRGDRSKAADILNGPEGLPPPPSASASLVPDGAPPLTPLTPGISLEELPPPPDRPMLSKKLKLNAILGDHVILTFKDRRFQKQNRFKQYITLAQGQEFDTVTLVAIGKDKATLEEHGRQITMELDPIR